MAMVMMIIIQAAEVTPRKRVEATCWNSGWSKATTRLPRVRSAPTPLTTYAMASVAMRALIRKRVTRTPFATPTARPRAMPPAMATGTPAVGHQLGGGGARQSVDGADREVDAAGDEHQRAGGRDDDDARLLVQDVGEVLGSQEWRAHEGQDDQRRHERDEDARPSGRARGRPGRDRMPRRDGAPDDGAAEACSRGARDHAERGVQDARSRSSRRPPARPRSARRASPAPGGRGPGSPRSRSR